MVTNHHVLCVALLVVCELSIFPEKLDGNDDTIHIITYSLVFPFLSMNKSIYLSMFLSFFLSMYIYIYVSVCVCVCDMYFTGIILFIQ